MGASETLRGPLARNRYIGTTRRFNYPRYFTSLPEYTAHRGVVVKVLRRLTTKEADPENQPMYEVRALKDGWIGHAWPDELGRPLTPAKAPASPQKEN